MNKILILLTFFSFSLSAARPQEPTEPLPYQVEDICFDNKAVQLCGTLTKPKEKALATVILIWGYGPMDRDESLSGHRPFLVLADYLTRQGMNVLRFDKRGVGKSNGSYQESTRADFADDVLAAIDFLKEKDLQAPIGLIGHSEGGMIGAMVAAKSKDVSFLVMMASPAIAGETFIIEQTELLGKASGKSDEEIKQQVAFMKELMTVISNEDDIQKAQTQLATKLPPTLLPLATQFNSVNFRYFLKTDPATFLRQLKIPVLALNGDRDWIVPAKTQLPAIEKALKEAGNKHYTIEVLPNLNHLFQTCVTGTQEECTVIDETIAPIALETISDWIKTVTK